MGFPTGNLGMIIAAIAGGLGSCALLLVFLIAYRRRKKKQNGYRRLEPRLLVTKGREQGRAKSCFDIRCSIQENTPVFNIPVTKPKTQPKRTCQIQFSLLYNFHTSVLKIQVICAVNLPRLFGLHSGVFVKVHLLSSDGRIHQDLGKTATQFLSKNPVFKDHFETKATPFEELRDMTLSLSLYSFDRFTQRHFVGNTVVKFADENLDPLEAVMFWRPVQPKSASSPSGGHEKGYLVISLRYQERTGRINVVVMKAVKLATPKRLLRTDPYVIVKLFRNDKVIEKKRTQPCKRNLNPVWNEPFVFDFKNGQLTGYKFVFEIKSADVVAPDASLGRIEISQESSEHWSEMMAKKNYARAMSHKVN